ncbi:MAG: hypothetical protein GY910_14340 [bacterium]|nr:hypothetical protein [bacterium]
MPNPSPTHHPTGKPPEHGLRLAPIVSFSIASIGVTAMVFLNALYLFKYATDVLLIAPGVMGLIYGAGRIWDAVSDPLIGRMSDRTHSRLGRRRSWIFASIPATSLAFMMLWAPPEFLVGPAIPLWIGVGLVLFSTAQTMFSVPHYALGVEMTNEHHERTRIFGLRQLMNGAGLLVGLGAFFTLVRAEDPRSVAPMLAVALSILAACLTAIGISRLRERADYQGRGGENLTQAFWDIFRNPHARLLLTMYGIESFGLATSGILSLYVTEYVVKAPATFYLIVLMLHIVPSFIVAPLWIRVSKRLGKRRLWFYSTIVASIAYLLHSFLGEGTIVFWCAISIVQGTTAGVAQVVGPSIKGDVIDWDELQSGERREGSYLAAWTFVYKSAGGLCGIFVGFALQTVGFEPNVEQTEATKWTILLLYGALPAAAYAAGAYLLSRFRLNEAEHAAVRAELDARGQAD